MHSHSSALSKAGSTPRDRTLCLATRPGDTGPVHTRRSRDSQGLLAGQAVDREEVVRQRTFEQLDITVRTRHSAVLSCSVSQALFEGALTVSFLAELGTDVPWHKVHSFGLRGIGLESHALKNRDQQVESSLKPDWIARGQKTVIGIETDENVLHHGQHIDAVSV